MSKGGYLKIDAAVLDYYKSNKTAIVFSRLLYWSNKKSDGFYKFKSPCNHPLYKKGDSWCEELGMTKSILDPIFKRLVTYYKSKNDYRNATDKFQSKMFCSYTERNTNKTYYFMDKEAVDKFLASLGHPTTSKPTSTPAPSLEVSTFGKADKNMSSTTPRGAEKIVPLRADASNSLNTQTITSLSGDDLKADDAEREKEKLSSKKMVELWNSHTQDRGIGYPLTADDVPTEAQKQAVQDVLRIWREEMGDRITAFSNKSILNIYNNLRPFFGEFLERFKDFMSSITSSSFLMGKVSYTKFKAYFWWIIKPETIKQILNGAYGVEYILSQPKSEETKVIKQPDLQQEILISEESQEIKDFRILCLKTVGKNTYISYFKKLSIEFREGDIVLIAAHKFGADFLNQNYFSYLQMILEGLEGHITRISILAPGETDGRVLKREWRIEKPNLLPISTLSNQIQKKILFGKTQSHLCYL